MEGERLVGTMGLIIDCREVLERGIWGGRWKSPFWLTGHW